MVDEDNLYMGIKGTNNEPQDYKYKTTSHETTSHKAASHKATNLWVIKRKQIG